MWDDIKIGTGEKRCSAVVLYRSQNEKYSFDISHNDIQYWISDLLFGMGMVMYKDTPEGQRLAKLLAASKKNDKKIRELLDILVLNRISHTRLLAEIDNLKRKSIEEGKELKTAEIKGVLGIYR